MESATGTAAKRGAPMDLVRLLSEELGGRRPCGKAERRAAQLVADRLTRSGVSADLQAFPSYATFALPYGSALAIALLGAPLARRHPVAAGALAAAGAGLTSAEDGFRWRPLSQLLAREESSNLVAKIEPRGDAERTVCLSCHLDGSRSGLMFH